MIVFTESGNERDDKLEQFSNADLPITITLLWIEIEDKFVQFLKSLSFIIFNCGGNVIKNLKIFWIFYKISILRLTCVIIKINLVPSKSKINFQINLYKIKLSVSWKKKKKKNREQIILLNASHHK